MWPPSVANAGCVRRARARGAVSGAGAIRERPTRKGSWALVPTSAELQQYLDKLQWWHILAATFVGAWVFRWILTRLVLGLTRKTSTQIDDQIVRSFGLPLFVTIVLLGTLAALKRADAQFGLGFAEHVLETIDRTALTIAILFWVRGLLRVADLLLDAMARHADKFQWIQARSLPLYDITSKLLLVAGGVWFILAVWEKNLTPFLASAGIVGIAVGFAAKDTLANLFAGVFIMADAPYKIGDFIVLDSGERGRVTDIGIRSTRLITRDDIEITLPNAVMANAKIMNETGGPHQKMRVRVNIGVAYGSDIDKVREILLDIASKAELVDQDPPPSVRFREFGDSALLFQLRAYIHEPVVHGRAIDALNTAIYKRFNEAGVEIPFPQRVVTMNQ